MTIETTKPAAADDTAYGSEVAARSTGQRGVRAGGATVAYAIWANGPPSIC